MDIINFSGAFERLSEIAFRDTNQSRRVANFLLAWANSEKYGGFHFHHFGMLDTEISSDMLIIIKELIAGRFFYPRDLGQEYEDAIIEISKKHYEIF